MGVTDWINNNVLKPAIGAAAPIAAAKGAYGAAYGQPASQIKTAYDQAAARNRSLAQDLSGQYEAGRQRAQGYYGGAESILAAYGGGGSYQPSFGGYGGGGGSGFGYGAGYGQSGFSMAPLAQRSVSLGAANAPAYGTFTQPNAAASGITKAPGTPGFGSFTSGAPGGSLFSSMWTLPNSGGSQPGQFRTSTQPGSMAAGWGAATAQPMGGGGRAFDNPVDTLKNYLNNFNAYQPTVAQDWFSQRSSTPYSSMLEDQLGRFSSFAGGRTLAEGRMDARQTYTPSATVDMNEELSNVNPNQYTDTALLNFRLGQTPGGSMMSDLAAGNTLGTGYARDLAAGGGNTGGFLADFDPNASEALRPTYQKLAAEGPTYEEDFYTSLLAGENPAYNKLQEDFVNRTRAAAAARGGFVSGKAMGLEEEGLADLAANEFANRGALAGQAGAARRERLGQELGGAEALDSMLLGRQSLQGELGLGLDSLIGDLYGQGDSLRANLAGNQDSILADLARAGDTNAANMLQLRLAGAGQADDLIARNLEGMDNLAMSGDATRTARMGDYGNLLTNADTNRNNFYQGLDALAGTASSEANAAATRRLDATSGLADQQRNFFRDQFDAAIRLGDSRAAVDRAYDMARLGQMSEAEVRAMAAEMARAGVDAQTIQAFIGDALTLVKEGVKAATASGG